MTLAAPRPITLRCPKCKKHEDFEAPGRRSAEGIVRTTEKTRLRQYNRRQRTQYRVKHLLCGFVWWTMNENAAKKPLEG